MVRLEARGLTVEYDGYTAIENVDLVLESPALVALLGPNGAGKTTLMRALLGLVKPSRGQVLVDGEDVTGSPSRMGKYASYVPQRPPVGRFAPFTPWELVCTALQVRRGRWPRIGCPFRGEVERALEAAGLSRDAWHRRLSELSGGMLMRSFIARSLAIGARIVFMDEPFAPVDPAGRVSLARLIGEMARTRLVVVSLHDYMILQGMIDLIVLINRRLIAVGRPEEVLRPDILRRVYGGLIVEVERHVHIADWHG